jgi:hypothetical protein
MREMVRVNPQMYVETRAIDRAAGGILVNGPAWSWGDNLNGQCAASQFTPPLG